MDWKKGKLFRCESKRCFFCSLRHVKRGQEEELWLPNLTSRSQFEKEKKSSFSKCDDAKKRESPLTNFFSEKKEGGIIITRYANRWWRRYETHAPISNGLVKEKYSSTCFFRANFFWGWKKIFFLGFFYLRSSFFFLFGSSAVLSFVPNTE